MDNLKRLSNGVIQYGVLLRSRPILNCRLRISCAKVLAASFATAAASVTFAFLTPAASQVVHYPYTDLTGVYPAGGQRGQRVTVTFTGVSLSGLSGVRASGTGVTVRSFKEMGARQAQAELEISPDAPLGRRNLRVVSRSGVSDPVWFQVGQLPEVMEKEPNPSVAESQPVELPVVVNARLNPGEDVDAFRFRARAGEVLTLAVEGFVLDSQRSDLAFLDTTLTVYDATGRIVARNEDFQTLDPLLTFRPEKDGEYVAEIREQGYGGGDGAVYRLTLGTVPWATALYPAGGRRGTTVSLEVGKPDGVRERASLTVPANCPDVLDTALLPGQANTRPFVVGDLPEVLEQEPNDTPAQANPLTMPAVYNGRIERKGDRDAFRVPLRKGEGIRIDVLAGRILRSPVDLTLTVLNEAGNSIAANDDNPHTFEATDNREDSLSGDPLIELIAPADGVYTVVIRDIGGRGHPDFVYRASVTPREPSFTLDTWYDNPLIMGPGACGVIPVQIHRYAGFAGEVKLRITGLPTGYTGSEAIIPAGRLIYGPSASLTIRAPAEAKVGTLVPFGIEGEAEVNGRKVVIRTTPLAHLGQNNDHGIRRVTDTFLACVVPAEQYRIEALTRSVAGAPGQVVPIPLKIERLGETTGVPTLIPLRGLGRRHDVFGFSPPLSVKEENGRFEFPLSIPKDLAPGEYTFVLCRPLAGDFRGNRPTTTTEVIRLTVTGARTASVAAAGGKK